MGVKNSVADREALYVHLNLPTYVLQLRRRRTVVWQTLSLDVVLLSELATTMVNLCLGHKRPHHRHLSSSNSSILSNHLSRPHLHHNLSRRRKDASPFRRNHHPRWFCLAKAQIGHLRATPWTAVLQIADQSIRAVIPTSTRLEGIVRILLYAQVLIDVGTQDFQRLLRRKPRRLNRLLKLSLKHPKLGMWQRLVKKMSIKPKRQ